MRLSLRRYVSHDEDSARWENFPFRAGDIIVSTRSKHGTTWMQAILLMLIHQRPELPVQLAELSPWLDHLVEPRDTVVARLAAQNHRRVIKTHTPLDGVPLDSRATYVVVARHPLDGAVSLYHHHSNIDRARMHQLIGTPVPAQAAVPASLDEWLRHWIDRDADPVEQLDSLPGVMWHLSDAWSRRSQGNVVLVHFDDLLADLHGQMRRLAGLLDIDTLPGRWDELVEAATFDGMRARADERAPDRLGVLRDPHAFFRNGVSGDGARALDRDALARYQARAAALAPPRLLEWLHR